MKILFFIFFLSVFFVKNEPAWIEIAKSNMYRFSFDKNNIKKLDSSIITIWIKEVPLPESFNEVKIGKMKENRAAAGYDELMKPKYNFYGFESYGFAILREEINCVNEQYRILKTIEYDLNGEVLKDSEEQTKWAMIIPGTGQRVILDSLCR